MSDVSEFLWVMFVAYMVWLFVYGLWFPRDLIPLDATARLVWMPAFILFGLITIDTIVRRIRKH